MIILRYYKSLILLYALFGTIYALYILHKAVKKTIKRRRDMISKETLEKHENYSNTNNQFRTIEKLIWFEIQKGIRKNGYKTIISKLINGENHKEGDTDIIKYILGNIAELLDI
jgi:hypothetical protein